uniref:Uncharacterized protein n=1 Tax=Anguilla anguilla TaxID=7936 RepID=A0A0E9UZH2_ANGAN
MNILRHVAYKRHIHHLRAYFFVYFYQE